MAYYPLKVKDNSGNTHVVGDPRIADKADKASPTFTGTPAAPTAAADTNTTQVATTAFVLGQAGSTNPVMNGTVAVGTATRFARADHVHPTDTSRATASHTHTSDQVSVVTRSVRTGSYTLVLNDAGALVEMGSASAQTLTIPTNSSVAFPVGTKIDILQTGAGECSIAPVDGTVTLNSESNKRKINAQWQAVTLIKRDANTWVLIGALKA